MERERLATNSSVMGGKTPQSGDIVALSNGRSEIFGLNVPNLEGGKPDT